jgi:hypothetical protein
MTRRIRQPSEAAIARAVAGVRRGGLPVSAVEISDGTLRILVGPGQPAQDAPEGNSCDDAWAS